jgi:hypothetical protein
MLLFPELVKQTLFSIIDNMSNSIELFVKHPGIDFTRNRKLPFDTVMKLLISFGGNSIYKELLDSLGFNVNTVTTSGFIQQRDKILPYAFEFLFHEFTKTINEIVKYRNYRLLAIDGTDLNIARNPNCPDTFINSKNDEDGFNALHLNVFYDLYNKLYVDALIQPRKQFNEYKALVDMVDRSNIEGNVIVLGDRGFESFNNFAHIQNKGWKFLIRIKDFGSTGIIYSFRNFLPSSGEFDVSINRLLTKTKSKEVLDNPDLYKFLSNHIVFDFLDNNDNNFYPFNCRIVRFKITDNSYETVITNLSESDFPADELKQIYNLRWGIESSIRDLKYSVALTSFHAKKQEYIIQEIFAKIIMYNFAFMITSHVVISQNDTEHIYQVNFKVAILVCRNFLRFQNSPLPQDVEAIIMKNILPVRPGRKYKRKTIRRKEITFFYRVA